MENVRAARVVVGTHQVIPQPQFSRHGRGLRLLGQEAVRAGFEDKAINCFCLNYTAQPRTGLDQHFLDWRTGLPCPRQRVCSGKTGDTAADNCNSARFGDVSHTEKAFLAEDAEEFQEVTEKKAPRRSPLRPLRASAVKAFMLVRRRPG